MIILKLNIQPVSADRLNKTKLYPSCWQGTKVKWLSQTVLNTAKFIEQYDKPPQNHASLNVVCELNYEETETRKVTKTVFVRDIEDEIKKLDDLIKANEGGKLIQDEEILIQKERLENILEELKCAHKDKKEDKVYKEEEYRLGYYVPKADATQPGKVVMLMQNCIKNVTHRQQQQPEEQDPEDACRFLSTYIHELFHAYFDSDSQQLNRNSVPFIEEPITEYAMLKFIEEHEPRNLELLDCADEVKKKQESFAICHYGFGYFLWEWEKDGNKPLCDWVELFRKVKHKIGDSEIRKEFEAVFEKGFYPFGKETQYMELLYRILKKAEGKTVVQTSTPRNDMIPVFPTSLTWEIIGPQAVAAHIGDTLYLDGAFFFRKYWAELDYYQQKHGVIIKEIVLCEHFVCDTFKRFGSYVKRIISVHPKNHYYTMEEKGRIIGKIS